MAQPFLNEVDQKRIFVDGSQTISFIELLPQSICGQAVRAPRNGWCEATRRGSWITNHGRKKRPATHERNCRFACLAISMSKTAYRVVISNCVGHNLPSKDRYAPFELSTTFVVCGSLFSSCSLSRCPNQFRQAFLLRIHIFFNTLPITNANLSA